MYDIDINWLHYILKIENATILAVLSAVLCICLVTATDIKKESKSLEEHCRETMKKKKEKQKTDAVKSSLIKIAKHKYMELLAEEMESQFNENTMEGIAIIAFAEITTGVKYKNILPNHHTSTATEQENPRTEQENPSTEQDTPTEQDNTATEQDTPTEQEDTPIEQENPPTEQEDTPIEQENPPTEQEGVPLVVTVDVHTPQENEETSVRLKC
uniref:Uncharacterized protein n=1 Tax=Amphimedon queenslandica TaxID=400682 RepID=A0A1X7TWS7_AMPQE